MKRTVSVPATRKVLIVVTSLLVSLASCEQGEHADRVHVTDPVIRLPSVPGHPAAGYFGLAAPEDRIALVGVTSPRASRIEMHETVTANGISSMRVVERQQIRHQDIEFAPGARHLMIFGLDPALKAGEQAPLVFQFERGSPATASATVIAAGDSAH